MPARHVAPAPTPGRARTGRITHLRRRGLAVLAAAGTVATAVTVLASPAQAVVVSNPPASATGHNILVFPQRDFVSASGYAADDQVVVKLIHPNGTVISTDPNRPVSPQPDPRAANGAPFAGIVEVNHPGGSCWFTTTPDIRAGDVVEIDVVAGPAATLDDLTILSADATTVANVTVQRPVQTAADTVVVHGTAAEADGTTQIPIAELDQRMVANRDAFDLNGRRTIRAAGAGGGDGTIAYDAPDSTSWTATYSGLDAADVTRTLGAESRILWLGRAVAPALEGTIFENGAAVIPGPAAPQCTAPLEKLPPPPGSDAVPPSDVAGLVATVPTSPGNTVNLTWDAASDNIGVTSYGIYRNGVPIFNVQNPDGSAPAPTSFVDKNVPPGTYTYTVDAADAVGNRSVNLSTGADATTNVQTATLPPGTTVNEPPVAPVQIISFPSRDFISSSGFDEADTVDVQLLRHVDGVNGLTVISSADGVTPQPDPRAAPGDPFAGIVEVNHPGGANWSGITPDIRVGDIVRTIAYRVDDQGAIVIRTVDQTTTANVTVDKLTAQYTDASAAGNDGEVRVHGIAMQADGSPIPLGQFEQRLIANRDAFALNGRRTIRAGGAGKDGTLTYDADDPTGTHWTAVYSGLAQEDVDRIRGTAGFDGAEFRALWLGSQPLAGLELTIYENGPLIANGPSIPPCDATCQAEAPDITRPSAPPALNGEVKAAAPKDVELRWAAATDDVAVRGYGVYRDGVRIANLGPDVTSYKDVSVTPGTYQYTVDAVDAASPDGGAQSGQNKEWGNRSFPSDAAAVVVKDTTPPSVPADLTALTTDAGQQNDAGQAVLHWTASTDDIGVDHYRVYRDTVLIADNVPASTFTDTGLPHGTYSYTVDAVDAAGNASAQSAPTSAVVPEAQDTTPPTAPALLTASTTPDIHGRDITIAWADTAPGKATDNVAVTGYKVVRYNSTDPNDPGTTIATLNDVTFAYRDVNPGAGTYDYAVRAADSAGNLSVPSNRLTAVVANDPPVAPHSLIAFPARDFISATGYTPGESYTFSLIRAGQTYTSAPFPADATGLVEVNHPGGTCWTLNTPDMRPGDVIRITDSHGVAEQTTVANVTAERPIATGPGTVVIHGTAADANGNPIPVDQLDQRLIANRDAFALNGRRTIRAGAAGDGVLAYDGPNTTRWTATYTGLTPTDVIRAVGGTTSNGTVFVGSESRILWLGRAPLALTETTIFENGPGVIGGPAGPTCTAPAETPVAAATFTPASITFPGTQFLPAPAASSATQTVTFANGGGAPMTLTDIYLAGANPGDFARVGGTCATVFPSVIAPGTSCTVAVRFTPTAIGLRQAALAFTDNAANTTDQSVTLTATGVDNTDPTIGVSPTSFNFGTVNGGSSPTKAFVITNTSNDPTGRSLSVSNATVTGTNPGDFTVVGNTCGAAVALVPADPANGIPAGTCTVTVQFQPGARAARSATLTLTHSRTRPANAASTTVALTGTGGNGAVISFGSNPVNFGTVNRSTTKDQTISVKNGGNAIASGVTVTASGNGFTRVSTTCGTTIPVNGSCNVVVRYSAGASAGSATGSLAVFASNGMPLTASTVLNVTIK